MVLIFRDIENCYVSINMDMFVIEIDMPNPNDPDKTVKIAAAGYNSSFSWEVIPETATRVRERIEKYFNTADLNCLFEKPQATK